MSGGVSAGVVYRMSLIRGWEGRLEMSGAA
jgi:hypothetical protein